MISEVTSKLTAREKNRLREHGTPPHKLTETTESNPWPVGGYERHMARIHKCSCGWLGWLRAGITTRKT